MTEERTIDAVRFDAVRNALYHTARRRSCERLAQVMNFLVIVLGAATVGNLLESLGVSALIGVDNTVLTGSGVAMVGGASMAFDFAGRAANHRQLQSDYYRLLADIVRAGAASKDRAAEFDAQLVAIYANEPPVRRAVDAKAYNDALDALRDAAGYSAEDRLVIPWWHSLLGGLFFFEGHEYKRKSDSGT